MARTTNTKTLNVKGSRADTTAANAAAVRKVVDTWGYGATRNEIAVYLNCDAGGTLNLDGVIQITPDVVVGSEVWYQTDAWTQVVAGTSQQVKVPAAIGRKLRCNWTLTGVHNFGSQITFPLAGYTPNT